MLEATDRPGRATPQSSASHDPTFPEPAGAAELPNPYRYLRICAWGGPVLLVVLILFWGILGRNIPPYSGALSAEELAAEFRTHAVSLRLGMVVTMLIAALYTVWGMAITKVMEQVERDNDILSRLQLMGAVLTTVILIVPPAIWLSAAYRPDADPQIIRALYDFGWILFDLAVSVTSMQFITFGVCFLTDRRQSPLVPRWISWFTIWVGAMFVVFGAMPFFQAGPFSRNGLVNYWLEFSIFFYVMIAMCVATLRAVGRLEREHQENLANG